MSCPARQAFSGNLVSVEQLYQIAEIHKKDKLKLKFVLPSENVKDQITLFLVGETVELHNLMLLATMRDVHAAMGRMNFAWYDAQIECNASDEQ